MPPPENIHLGRGRHAEPIDSTEPVAANPAAMRTYSTDAPEKTAELRTLIGEAATALANYRQNAILSGAGFRGRSIEWDNAWTDTQGTGNSATDALLELCDDFDHLDAFVGSVADAIYEAEDLDDQDPQADQLHHLTAGDIAEHGDINDARREFANEDAQTDVQELRALFEAVDVNFEDFTGGTIYLPDGELNRELYDQLAVMVEQMSEDEYASTMFNELGAPGTRAILDYISRVSNGQDRYDTLPDDLDITTDLLLPFAEGFATASHTLDESTREDLLDVGDSWRTHLHLTMLLSGDGSHYESQFLADAAEIVLVSERSSDFSSDPQPYPWMSEALVSRQTLLETLGENPEAAWLFVNSDPENLKYILEGPPEGDEQAAQVFEAAFLQAPLDDPSIFPEAVDLYGDVVHTVGNGDVPDPLRRSVAGSTWLYLDEIGQQATHGTLGDFNRPDIVAFFQQLGHDDQSISILGESFAIWASARSSHLVRNPDFTQRDVEEAYLPVAMLIGTVWDGLDETERDLEVAHGAWLNGFQQGSAIALGVGLALIPEPTTTAGGLLLIAGSQVAPLARKTSVDHVTGRPEGMSIDGDDMQRLTVQQISMDLARAITEDRDLEMPEVPGPNDDPDDPQYMPGVGEEGWVNEILNILRNSSTQYQGDPTRDLNTWINDQHQDYEPSDHWTYLL